MRPEVRFWDKMLPNLPEHSNLYEGSDFVRSLFETICQSSGIRDPRDEFTLEQSEMFTVEEMASNPVAMRFLQFLIKVMRARRVLEITSPDGQFAKGRAENVQRFLTPRGSGAMGLAYAALARAATSQPDLAREDRRRAATWLNKSLAAWRGLQSDPAFSPSHKQEMRKVELAAADISP